jgi:hypothetical protein
MPRWLWEILVSLGVAARILGVFVFAIAFGIVVAIKIADGSLWVASAVAVGVLLVVVLPFRLWWVMRKRVPK